MAMVTMAVLTPFTIGAQDTTLAVAGRANSTPSVAADGRFVAIAWGGVSNGEADVFLAVSRDRGHTFGTPVRVNATAGEARLGGELPPRVVLRRDGAADPEIAVLWTARGDTTAIRVARSRDGGRTFGAPVALQASGAPGDRGWPAVAVDAGGQVHAIWLDHRGLAAAAGHHHAEGGHKASTERDGVAMAQRSGLYFATASTDPRERELVRGVCYCCKTALAAAPNGLLVAAWRHVYPGNQRDIAFSTSRDGGRSFSQPTRVSPDNWEIDGCPDDGPALAVDGGGIVHLVWPTVIGRDEPEGALFYASSQDGRAFTARRRIPTMGSPRPMHPQIAVHADGRIAVAWEELLEGRRVAAVRELKPAGATGFSSGPVLRLSGAEPGAYPVLAAADDGFVAAWTAGRAGSTTIRVRRIALP